jgi:hypothetical protein
MEESDRDLLDTGTELIAGRVQDQLHSGIHRVPKQKQKTCDSSDRFECGCQHRLHVSGMVALVPVGDLSERPDCNSYGALELGMGSNMKPTSTHPRFQICGLPL